MKLKGPLLLFKKMSPKAFAPARVTEQTAGFLLKSAYELTVPAKGRMLCKTDLQLAFSPGHYGRIAPRASLVLENGINVVAGVIDEEYRGNVGVVMFNHSDNDFKVHEGDSIAYLICQKLSNPELVEVSESEVIDDDCGICYI